MAVLAGLSAAGANAVKGDGVLDVVFPDYAERAGGVAAYDSARNRLVRFGGYGYPQGWPLTSEWDGQKWIPVETAEVPPAPDGCQMVYDAARSNVVLFGGYMAVAETWLYNGTAWTNARPAHTPSARTLHQMVYDSARQRVVLFGGSQDAGVTNALGDTWEWDGADWQQMAPAVSPAPRWGHQMTFDAARGVTVLYKGQNYGILFPGFGVVFTLNEQWTYDGTTWSTNGCPTSFPSGAGPLVFNPARGAVEFFAGFNGGSGFKLWTLAGTQWTSQTFGTSPPSGGQLTDLDYVSSTGTAVYVWSAANAVDRTKAPHTWAWNGSNWTCRTPYEPVSFVSASAWADVNGDDHPDRVVCGNIQDTTSGAAAYGKALFLHDGANLCPTPAWLKRDNVSVTRVVLGDVTGDGRPDAVFSSAGTQKIELYAYTGGTFAGTPSWQSDTTYDIAEIQLVDIDGDKDLDLVALRKQSGQAAILVFTNGAGSLGTAPAYVYSLPQLPGGSSVNASVDANLRGGSMAWADIDHDGKPECAVGYYYPLGAGYHVGVVKFTGTTGVEVLRLDNVQSPVAFADVDVDGYPDLIGTARSLGPALFHNTDGVIGGTASWVASFYGAVAVDMAVGDFDGDGDPDLATSHNDNGTDSLGHLLYRNDGGTFGAIPDWRSHEGVGTDAQAGMSVDLLDFDGDGVRDVVADRGVYLLDRVLRDTVPPRPPRYAIGTAAPPGTNTIALQWDASPDADVAAYRIYRGMVSGGTGNRFIAEVPGTQTSYLYADPAGGFDQYWIYAIDAAGNEGGWARTELIGSRSRRSAPWATAGLTSRSPDRSWSWMSRGMGCPTSSRCEATRLLRAPTIHGLCSRRRRPRTPTCGSGGGVHPVPAPSCFRTPRATAGRICWFRPAAPWTWAAAAMKCGRSWTSGLRSAPASTPTRS